jgi:hypothetical protein
MLRALVLLALTADGGTMPLPTTPVRPTGYPLARLNVKGNPVVPLALKVDEGALEKLGVKQVHRYSATTPTVWLIAFETANYEAAEALAKKLDPLFPEAPYYRKTSVTGAWLLVTGFPGTKPVSPEMEAARTTFISSWAGEE